MNLSSCRWLPCWLLAISLGAGSLALCERAAAADAASAGATAKGVVKPYTGPPIYLDEPATTVPPTLVERQTVTDKYPSGEVRFERQIARFSDNHLEADGFYREYYKNGQLFAEGQYRRGRQQGNWTYYHDNGTVNHKVTFEDGLPNSQVEVYRADGTLMAKRNYSKGLRTGDWITYDDTGKQPLREELYNEGQPEGEWKSWFPSGQLQRQIAFKDGKRTGIAKEWNEDGSQRGEVTYADGELDGPTTIWLPDGRKIVREYGQGKLLSESIH
jgi:antitoxin component YwqK of YwqJK toxin-antitoxin module